MVSYTRKGEVSTYLIDRLQEEGSSHAGGRLVDPDTGWQRPDQHVCDGIHEHEPGEPLQPLAVAARPNTPGIWAAVGVPGPRCRRGYSCIQRARLRGWMARGFLVAGQEPMRAEEDEIQASIHGQHDENDQPAGKEVDQQADLVRRKPAP